MTALIAACGGGGEPVFMGPDGGLAQGDAAAPAAGGGGSASVAGAGAGAAGQSAHELDDSGVDDPSRAADGGGDTSGKPKPVPAPVASGCFMEALAGTHDVPCDGITHRVSVGESCLHTQCGLIIDVHGGTMSALMEDNNTKLSVLGPEHGYVVIQPSAAGGLWNAATDDAKILAFAKLAIGVFHLDEKRVHMTGFSQGGYMTWRFICQHTAFLASAAPAAAAGAANISLETDCAFTGSDVPSEQIPILYMHGTKDALVNYQNAMVKRDAVVAQYQLGAGKLIAGDTTYRRTRYTNASGGLFEHIDHDYVSSAVVPIAIQGHCYPGSDDQMATAPGQLMPFGCVPPNSFTWGETLIDFFVAHPRK